MASLAKPDLAPAAGARRSRRAISSALLGRRCTAESAQMGRPLGFASIEATDGFSFLGNPSCTGDERSAAASCLPGTSPESSYEADAR